MEDRQLLSGVSLGSVDFDAEQLQSTIQHVRENVANLIQQRIELVRQVLSDVAPSALAKVEPVLDRVSAIVDQRFGSAASQVSSQVNSLVQSANSSSTPQSANPSAAPLLIQDPRVGRVLSLIEEAPVEAAVPVAITHSAIANVTTEVEDSIPALGPQVNTLIDHVFAQVDQELAHEESVLDGLLNIEPLLESSLLR